jgi:hypothetical protein
MKPYKKYLIFLGILTLISPIGLIVPELFKAGDAWGEWSVKTVKELVGYEPVGMKKTAGVYSSPIPDYNLGKEDDPIAKRSLGYIISGVIGAGAIVLLSWGIYKIVPRKKK